MGVWLIIGPLKHGCPVELVKCLLELCNPLRVVSEVDLPWIPPSSSFDFQHIANDLTRKIPVIAVRYASAWHVCHDHT
jgi:hypothetical protein